MLLALLLIPAGQADELVLTGSVVSVETETILVPVNGSIASLFVREGEYLMPMIEVATMQPNYICAEQAGVVTMFGGSGEDVSAVTERYGGVWHAG